MSFTERMRANIAHLYERADACAGREYAEDIRRDAAALEAQLVTIAAARRARTRDWRAAAFCAMLAECDRTGWPGHYLPDVSRHDYARLFEQCDRATPIPFVWVLRDCGSHMALGNGDPREALSMRITAPVFGTAGWYWYEPGPGTLTPIDAYTAVERLQALDTREATPKERHFYRCDRQLTPKGLVEAPYPL